MTKALPDRVVVISDFATVKGGASKLALLNAELMALRGVPVSLVSGDAGTEDAPDGVEIIALGGQRLLEQPRPKAALNGLWNKDVQACFSSWVHENDVPGTIYHVHGYHQTLSPSVLSPLTKVRNRTVMHAHDYFLTCPNGAFFDFKLGTTCNLSALSGACVLRNCDKRKYAHKAWRVMRQVLQNRARNRLMPDVTTILIHEGMARRLFPNGSPGPLKILPNPAVPFLNTPISAEANQDIVYVGDIHAYKGVVLLAEAGRRAGVSVRFVGDGEDRSQLARSFPEHRYDGWQNREGLCDILANARLLVAPTLGPEPYGLAPVEALMSGIPVVMSDSMLLSADVENAGMGASFRAGDCDTLAQVLARLSSDDQAVARMSSAAAAHGGGLSMSADDWGAALNDIYVDLLNPAKGAARSNLRREYDRPLLP